MIKWLPILCFFLFWPMVQLSAAQDLHISSSSFLMSTSPWEFLSFGFSSVYPLIHQIFHVSFFLNYLSSDPLSYHLTIHLLFQLPNYQSTRLTILLPIQPSIYPTFHLLVDPSVCTVDFPSIHLSNVHPFSHSFCLYISPSIRVSTHQPIYLAFFLSICFSIYLLSVHRSIHLILCLSTFIYPRKSIHLSIYLVPFPVHLLFYLSPDPWRFRQSKKDDSPSVKMSLLKTLDKK